MQKKSNKNKKRKRSNFGPDISDAFISECETEFKSDKTNIIARNAVVMLGSMLATVDSNEANKVTHVFMNTVKKKNLKSTNQGRSGRCWMFGGLNMFRHNVLHALELENFEFSEVYLFFWDKLERSNTFLMWFIDNLDKNPGDRAFDFMLDDFMSDGGYWNFFANLIDKYGLVPKDAMKETFQSDQSEDMNHIIEERLRCCVNNIYKNRDKMSREELLELKVSTVKNIYNILVKFLGEPPKDFSWAYTNEQNNSNIIGVLTPKDFKNMIIPGVDIKDFKVLCDSPTEHLKYKQVYGIKYSTNVYNGIPNSFINININEISKYAAKSVLSGMPVWFAADVSQCFNPYFATLNDKMVDDSHIFGEVKDFNKGERITMRDIQGNHAMCLTGVNLDHNGLPVEWQVENSWGYFDHETRGEDGWLTMSHSWFKKYVIEIAIHKDYLSRTVQKISNQKPIMLEPWDSMAPALKVVPKDAPHILNFINGLKKQRM
jgi:bleomycin hydrolase